MNELKKNMRIKSSFLGKLGNWEKTKLIPIKEFDVEKVPACTSITEVTSVDGKKYVKITYGSET